MTLTKEEIEKISDLARIELTTEEKDKLRDELSEVVDYFQHLRELDTDSVDLHITERDDVVAVRADQASDSGVQEKILDNTPTRDGGFIKVKSVL